MLAVGLSQGAPHHYWYAALDAKLPGKTAGIIGKKILADQLFAAPFFAVTFIVFAALLEGRSLVQVLTHGTQNLVPTNRSLALIINYSGLEGIC